MVPTSWEARRTEGQTNIPRAALITRETRLTKLTRVTSDENKRSLSTIWLWAMAGTGGARSGAGDR